MKRLWMLMLGMGMALGVPAQNLVAERLSGLAEAGTFARVRMTAKAFELAHYLEEGADDAETEDFFRFVGSMEAMEMLVGGEVAGPAALYQRARGLMPPTHAEVMRIEEGEQAFAFYMEEANGRVYELVVLGHGPKEMVMLSLTGDMALEDLVRYVPRMEGEGFRYLGPLATEGVGEVKVYPNPAPRAGYLALEIPETLVGGTATWYSLDGRALQQVPLRERAQKLGTHGLAAGTYVLSLTQGGLTVKRRVVLK